MTNINIFVYGTLCDLPGDPSWARECFRSAPRTACTPGALYNYGPFPYATFDADDTTFVVGQLIAVDTTDEQFALLDRVERRAGYERCAVTVVPLDGPPVQALAYGADDETKQYLLPLLPLIGSGDWNALLTL